MSTLKADTIQSTSGGAATLTKQHAAKMWVDYTTVSSTAISKSFNVSSLTDNGTGDTTINLTSSMDGVDYAASGSSSYTYAVLMFSDNGKAAGSVDAETRNVSDSIGDSNDNSVLIHGDLA